MVTNLYESLLEELGRILRVPLFPDENNSCQIRLANGLEVQLELDKSGARFLIGTNLGGIPPGRYRETIMREALKANGAPPPRAGIFAYSRRADTFVLFRLVPTQELSGEKIAQLLSRFAEKGLEWRNAIKKGEVPSAQATASGPSGMFGMR